MSEEICSLFDLGLLDPLGMRKQQPRKGITMILDKGMGLHQFQDLLDTAGEYIDFIKLGFGTTALYPPHILQAKIRLARDCGVDLYPGGTFFEVAFQQGKVKDFLYTIKQLGLSKIEISDGTVCLEPEQRYASIRLAKEMGFDVITEYGKKIAGSTIEWEFFLETLASDLEAGSAFVIVEGRESGENVGIYDREGKIRDSFADWAKQIIPFQDSVIWEAPKKNQQVDLINRFGPTVNLGNIAPEDVYSLESLRRGLRSDTFFLEGRRGQL